MMNETEAAKVFETILSAPGMTDNVKIDLKMSRKNLLLLTSIIEKGLAPEGAAASFLVSSLSKEATEEIKAIAADCLQKGGLKELSDNIKTLQKK